MNIPKYKCIKCGTIFFGWSTNDKCDRCGSKLFPYDGKKCETCVHQLHNGRCSVYKIKPIETKQVCFFWERRHYYDKDD